jgi:cyanophycinase
MCYRTSEFFKQRKGAGLFREFSTLDVKRPSNNMTYFNETNLTPQTGEISLRGAIIAMGGNLRLDGSALRAFYEYSGSADGRVAILPTASLLPDAGQQYIDALSRFGLCSPAIVLPVRSREDAFSPHNIAIMRQATGVLMTGGDQMRLTTALAGTPLHHEILNLHARGGVIAGTSAGTAALSQQMIAFGQPGSHPHPRIAQLTPGLGLVDTVIFDQHFRQRNRLGRLIYAVTTNPGLLGVGVDEDTAAIIKGSRLTVAGSGSVTIVDGTGITGSELGEKTDIQVVSVLGVRLNILTSGGTYDLHLRRGSVPSSAVQIGEMYI